MRLRRVCLEYVPVRIDIMPAIAELNPFYRAAAMAFVQPYSLSAALGRITEETATDALARAYAEGVISGSPDAPFTAYSTHEWYHWLIDHPAEFADLRSVAEMKSNFVEGEDGGDVLAAQHPDESSQPPSDPLG